MNGGRAETSTRSGRGLVHYQPVLRRRQHARQGAVIVVGHGRRSMKQYTCGSSRLELKTQLGYMREQQVCAKQWIMGLKLRGMAINESSSPELTEVEDKLMTTSSKL